MVVTRREGEEIVVGDPAKPGLVIRVVSIGDGRVRIGVHAEKSILIHRREVAEKELASRRGDVVRRAGDELVRAGLPGRSAGIGGAA